MQLINSTLHLNLVLIWTFSPIVSSSIVGLPKVKRDKFSIFNFLSVTDDRQSSQATPTSSSGSAAASSLGSSSSAASGKRSRWDVADQGSKVKETPNVHETGRQQEHTIAAKTSTTSSGSIAAAEVFYWSILNPSRGSIYTALKRCHSSFK